MIKITTYNGKDVTFEIDSTVVGYSNDISFEYDNGKQDIRVIGEKTIKEFAFTQHSISGSFVIYYTNYDLLNDVVTFGTTATLSLKFGSVPDYTLTISNVKYGHFTTTLKIDEPVTVECTYVGESATLT